MLLCGLVWFASVGQLTAAWRSSQGLDRAIPGGSWGMMMGGRGRMLFRKILVGVVACAAAVGSQAPQSVQAAPDPGFDASAEEGFLPAGAAGFAPHGSGVPAEAESVQSLMADAGWAGSQTIPVNLGGSPLGVYTDAAGNQFDGTGWTVVTIDGAFHTGHPSLQGNKKVRTEVCIGQLTGPWLSLCNNSLAAALYRPMADPRGGKYLISLLPKQSNPGNAPHNSCQELNLGVQTYCHHWHGTATAGAAVGSAQVRAGTWHYTGAAPGANLLPIKAAGGTGTAQGWPWDSVVDSLAWVDRVGSANQMTYGKIAAVNLSVAGGFLPDGSGCPARLMQLDTIAASLKAKGIPVVMAAGNDAGAGIGSWTCGEHIIRVGATGLTEPTVPADYSNVSNRIQFWAPVGTSAEGAKVGSIFVPYPGGSMAAAGTSFAGPQVAGAYAVLREKLGAGPSLDELTTRLIRSGTPITGPRVPDATGVVINIADALNKTP